jgi:hypothetical protein
MPASSGEAEERGEKREERYTYTYIRTRIRQGKFSKVTLYVPVAKQRLVSNIKDILKREGSSVSRFMIEKFEEYYRLHEPGNPQQRLDTIMKLGKAYHAPKPICGFKHCLRDIVGVGVYLPNGKEYGLCTIHLDEAKELGPKVWRILSRSERDK